MDEIYVTYVDDEHVDNHDYDGSTDDDHDSSNDITVRAFDARVNPSVCIYLSRDIHKCIDTSIEIFIYIYIYRERERYRYTYLYIYIYREREV